MVKTPTRLAVSEKIDRVLRIFDLEQKYIQEVIEDEKSKLDKKPVNSSDRNSVHSSISDRASVTSSGSGEYVFPARRKR